MAEDANNMAIDFALGPSTRTSPRMHEYTCILHMLHDRYGIPSTTVTGLTTTSPTRSVVIQSTKFPLAYLASPVFIPIFERGDGKPQDHR